MVAAMTQETLKPRKKRGPPPTGHGTPVQVRMHPELLAALDAEIERHPEPKPTRPEMVRRILSANLIDP